jgi:hypothetical protein
MLQKDAAPLPAQQTRLDREGLHELQVTPKLGDRICDQRDRMKPSRLRQHAGAQKPGDAAQVSEREITPVIYVQIAIDVIRPDTQTDPRGLEQIDAGLLEGTRADTD